MTVSVEFWQLVVLLGTLVGACAGAGKLLLSQTQRGIDKQFELVAIRLDSVEQSNKEEAKQSQRSLDKQFEGISGRLDGIEQANKEEANQWKAVERDLMNLKADLPLHYVRREDYIRGQSILEAKLDGLAVKIENAQLRGFIGANKHAAD